MNASGFDQYETPTVARTILSSFRTAGIAVNTVSCWEESYRVVENLNNPFHKLVAETHTDTRSKQLVHTHTHAPVIIDFFLVVKRSRTSKKREVSSDKESSGRARSIS